MKRSQRDIGAEWASSLDPDELHMVCQNILEGRFDWRDYDHTFDSRPSSAFLDGVLDFEEVPFPQR